MTIPSYTILQDQKTFNQWCAALRASTVQTIGLDCEFIRRHTYWPELCLIQVCVKGHIFLIDPFALDLAPFAAVLHHKHLLKIGHALFQDCEIFNHLFGQPQAPIFDTQIAALFLNMGMSIGYSALHEVVMGTPLDKTQQLTDWSSRPLTPSQLLYASQDVAHLDKIYDYCCNHLGDRLSWAQEEMVPLTQPETYQVDGANLWQGIKLKVPVKKLGARKKMLLKSICQWREEEARARNMSRPRILSPGLLEKIVLKTPKTQESLQKIGVPPELCGSLWVVICHTQTKPLVHLSLPQLRIPKKKGPLYGQALQLWDQVAQALTLPRSMVASKQHIVDLLDNPRQSNPLSRGWRYEVFGKEVLKLLKNEPAS